MKIKKGDFVEIEYIGSVKDTDIIFDITDEELAKKKGIHQKGGDYGPRIICIGRNHILPALEASLIGKEPNQEYAIDLTPDQGFGKKDPKLIRTMPTEILLKQKIEPYPGLQIMVAGRQGIVRSVSRGRTLVDFNNPLASRTLHYKLKIISIITDKEKQLSGLVDSLVTRDFTIENFTIKTKKKIPEEIKKTFLNDVKETIPDIQAKFA